MSPSHAMNPVDFHVLLVLSRGSLYGYAIKQAVGEESSGAVEPEIGSLYRVLARLVSTGFVEQVEGAEPDPPGTHPGKRRKYYALTREGERALRDEVERLSVALDLARGRGLLSEGGS